MFLAKSSKNAPPCNLVTVVFHYLCTQNIKYPMDVIRLTGESLLTEPCAATIGFFDGVHLGHRFLVNQVAEEAKRRGLRTVVVTFDRHPREVVKTDYHPQMLSSFAEKTSLLASTEADVCVVLPFDERMASLSAHDFMLHILKERLGVKVLVTGYDNRFGHNRTEGFDDYVRFGCEMGIEVVQAKPLMLDGIGVSSSVVRSFLLEGEVEMAAKCLDYGYTLTGIVAHGLHIGTGMGFPTANIQPDDPHKLIPAQGVYAVRVHVGYDGEPLQGMMNIGQRPTFDGHETTLEVHLLHYSGDLYGQQLSVTFVKRLRSERKFRTSAELVAQLKRDVEATEEALKD